MKQIDPTTGEIISDNKPVELPDWIFDAKCDEEALSKMADDLLYTAKMRLYRKLGQIPEDQQKRLEARAFMDTIRAMTSMNNKRQKYILWALVEIEKRGLWHFADEEYESLAEMVNDIVEMEKESAAQGHSSYYDWNFIATELVPTLQKYGFSPIKTIAAMDNSSKLRTAVPALRQILRSDSDEKDKEIEEVLDHVINPDVSAHKFRDIIHNHREDPKLQSLGAGYYVTDKDGGGFITIKISHVSEVNAVERALNGIFEDDLNLMPRDVFALIRELSQLTKRKIVPTTAKVNADSLPQNSTIDVTCIIPIESLYRYPKSEVDNYIISKCFDNPNGRRLEVLSVSYVESKGNDMYILAVVIAS